MLKQQLEATIQQLKSQKLYRCRQLLPSASDTLSFNSNDYLTLNDHLLIKRAYQRGFSEYPTGSGGSMVVCGYHAIHRTLEQTIAQALQVDDALLFSSGYVANLSVLRLMAYLGVHILIDKAVHASIYDGLAGTTIAYTRYAQHNFNDLVQKLGHISQESVIITEGIFSMSGFISPLRDMAMLNKTMLVDEAHSFGVLGREGLGAVVQAQLNQQAVPLRVIPLGKACGASGALVAGDALWVDALLQIARAYIYSTAISPAVTYGILETVHIVRQAEDRRNKLNQLVRYFSKAIAESPLIWRHSVSPIQQLQLGCPHHALRMAQYLHTRGIICSPMRAPTVSKKETGLRIILNYHHEPEHIDYLVDCIHAYIDE